MAEEEPYILIQAKSRHGGYTFGKLREVVSQGSAKTIHFEGRSYALGFVDVFGIEFPTFRSRFQALGHKMNNLDGIVEGLENIISFLENHPGEKYNGHADMIRKVLARSR